MKSKQFRDIFVTAFNDPAAWRDWFFSEVAADDMIYVKTFEGRASAALLMQPYDFLFHGDTLRSGYISCVATRPEMRSRGLASSLIIDALRDARAKGYALCELIPQADHLYNFYTRQAFATVFYADRLHYTALHTFPRSGGDTVAPSFGLFHALEVRRGCGVVHSETDYGNILRDMAIDGNTHILAATHDDSGAMLFATESSDAVTVKSLLADSEALADRVLADLRDIVGQKPMAVVTPPLSGSPALLRPNGMGRIVNPRAVLGSLAATYPTLKLTVRYVDRELPENDGVYTVGDGKCVHGELRKGHFDLDIDPTVLTSILFSSHRAGSIFNIPTERPFMALMLD